MLKYTEFSPLLVDNEERKWQESGYEKGKEIWEDFKGLDGIICATDTMAIGLIQYLKERNISIPEQVMVTGPGNSNLSRVVTPSITTVQFSYEKSGDMAAKMLIDIVNKNDMTVKEIKMGYRIVENQSTM